MHSISKIHDRTNCHRQFKQEASEVPLPYSMGWATYSRGNLCRTLSSHRKKSQRYRAESGHTQC